MSLSVFETLASLLEYPLEGWPLRLTGAKRELLTANPQLFPALLDFSRSVDHLSVAQIQEQYTQTFDLNPVCTLDVGYHLFGENYKRGVFLANLRETEEPFSLGQEHQLPDYLPVLLRLLTRLEDEELRISLIAECLVPAVEKMLEALSPSGNPYGHLIRAINTALKTEVPESYSRIPSPPMRDAASIPGLYQIQSRG